MNRYIFNDFSLSKNFCILFVLIFFVNFSYADTLNKISVGYNHTGVIDDNSTLYMWGGNTYGQLGIKKDPTNYYDNYKFPQEVMRGAKSIFAGYYNSAIIKNDNTLWMTGRNNKGQLGDGTITNRELPIKIMNDVKSVSFGDTHTAIIKNDGTLWMTGSNYYGQLCNGTYVDSKVPVKIMDDVSSVALIDYNTYIIKSDGRLFKCGMSNVAEIDERVPYEMEFYDDYGNKRSVRQINVNSTNIFILLDDGSLWFTGTIRDFYGSEYTRSYIQFIIDSCSDADIKKYYQDYYAEHFEELRKSYAGTRVSSYGYLFKVINSGVKLVRATGTTFAILKNDNTLWMWGNNSSGQLGNGTTKDIYNPSNEEVYVLYNVMNNVEDVALDSDYTIARKQDGSIYTWGYDAYSTQEISRPKIFEVKYNKIAMPTGKTLEYNGMYQKGVEEGIGYTILSGNREKLIGNYEAILKLASEYMWADGTRTNKAIKWKITKAENPISLSVKKTTKLSYQYSGIKYRNFSMNLISVSRAKGTVIYKKTKGSNNIKINKKTGKVTVKRGTKKGRYTVEAKVQANGDANYDAKIIKVKFKIVVY